MEWRGLEAAAWAGTTWLFVPSLSCLFCGGRLASFLASAPWLPAHFRSYSPSVALNLAQQSFSVHGLLGKETPGWVSQGLRNASELPLYPSLTLFKASSPELREGLLCQKCKALS